MEAYITALLTPRESDCRTSGGFGSQETGT